MRTRAKFRCNFVRDHGDNKYVELSVVYSRVDGSENKDFTKATPSGKIEMQIDNPAASVQFKPGDFYYVDFTPAPRDAKSSWASPMENLNPTESV